MSESATVAGTLTAAMNQELSRDKKMWRELVTEAAEKGVQPDDAIVRRLGVAWEFDGVQAVDAFAVDVAAVKQIAKARHFQKIAQKNHAAFVEEHGEIAEIQKQINEMQEQIRRLQPMVKQAHHRETVSHGYKWQIQRIKNQTKRIYGEHNDD